MCMYCILWGNILQMCSTMVYINQLTCFFLWVNPFLVHAIKRRQARAAWATLHKPLSLIHFAWAGQPHPVPTLLLPFLQSLHKYIWNLAKLWYWSQTPNINIWTVNILKVSGSALISGMICNFEIEGLYFYIKVGMPLYWSTQKFGKVYIKKVCTSISKYYPISKNLQYQSLNSYSILKNLRYQSSNWGLAAPASAGLLIVIAGCSSVLGTNCSVTISLQMSVYP